MKTTSFGIGAVVSAMLVCAGGVGAGAASGLGGIAGRVRDSSGAALPGVVVTASCARNASLASTVTNGRGEYLLEGLPPGTCSVAFELSGFEAKAVPAIRLQPDQTQLVDNELTVAPISETVDVVAQRPPEPEPPPLPPPPVVAPVLRPVPQYDLSAVCGPSLPVGDAPPIARVSGLRYNAHRRFYAKGDLLVLDGGLTAGLQVGENYVVRRRFKAVPLTPDAKLTREGEHASGLIQIVEVRDDAADAVVMHACDEFQPGDYLAPFVPTFLTTTRPRGRPDYASGGPDPLRRRGRDARLPAELHGDRPRAEPGRAPGQRLTVFRPAARQAPGRGCRRSRRRGRPPRLGDDPHRVRDRRDLPQRPRGGAAVNARFAQLFFSTFSIFVAVIHFLPSFSATAPVTVAGRSPEQTCPNCSKTAFFVM